MSKLEKAILRLSDLLEPAISGTNATKISIPNEKDLNKQFKNELLKRSLSILDDGRAKLEGNLVRKLKPIDEQIFEEIANLPAFDNEKLDYFELVNAAAEVVVEVNSIE